MKMGKKKKNIADVVRSKKQQKEKKVNPFEVKINRQKHSVLGRKISKHDRGMPGLSRSKALNKRKATLLQEYEQRFKSNKFVDKRIGETDPSMTVEDKMMKRYAKERLTHHGKNQFNLNDEEELTHYGQSLSEIEKFEEPTVSDDEDELGLIDAKTVSEEHFGGFFTKKEMEEKDDNRPWKERMEEVISKSKKEKYERQMQKENNFEMTEKLDAEWKELRFLVSSTSKTKESDAPEMKADDFDIMVKELKFEMKGQPTDRLKTMEELAKEEKDKLEALEMDRIKRMKGETEEKPSQHHKSADDLDDCLALDTGDHKVLNYKDGKLNLEGDADQEDKSDESVEEEESESDEDSELSDKDDDEMSDEDDGDILPAPKTREKPKPKMTTNLQDKQKVMEAARKELPYTFKAPEEYDELVELLHKNCTEDQLIIVERIIKCHHPSLAEGNKQRMETFFALLTQYFCDLAIQEPVPFKLIDGLIRPLYALAKQSTPAAAHAIKDQIVDCRKEFSSICRSRAGKGVYPGFDTLLLLKLVSILFPTSDFRHPVTTPALLFIGEMLAKCRVDDSRSMAAGLFVCNLCLEYVSLSKRYVPEAINFLHGLLFLAADKDPSKVETVIPPFRPVGADINLLHITSTSSEEVLPLKVSQLLAANEGDILNTVQFRLSMIYSCLTLLQEFSVLYNDLTSYREIFASVTQIARKLPTRYYPDIIKEKLELLLSDLANHSAVPRCPLVMQKKKPMLMKTFEPKIEEVFDGRKTKAKGTKDYNEKQKLTYKYKRELKGAMRDLKQDARFLARQQLQEQLDRDAERKRKVNEIYQMLSCQEGEFKAMKRAKES